MGGNRFKRNDFSDEEIQQLFNRYVSLENKLTSLFSGKIKDTYSLWKYDLAINMSRESKRKLHHKINIFDELVPLCVECSERLTEIDLDEVVNRYRIRCSKCVNSYSWAKSENITEDKLLERAKKISKSKKDFFKTESGKKIAKIVGEKNSEKMKTFVKTEQGLQNIKTTAIKNSETMREKISKGIFTPTTSNSWTHWKATITLNGESFSFRSSWEACFWLCNPGLKYEKIRIPYFDKSIERSYIADFYDEKTNTIYEIKPTREWIKQASKMNSVINHCIAHDIKFIWINEKNILNYIDERKFDNANLPQYNKMIKGIK